MVGSLALLMPGAGEVLLVDWRAEHHTLILRDSNEDQS